MNTVKTRSRAAAGCRAAYDRGLWLRLFAGVADGRPDALGRLYDVAAERIFGLAIWRLGSSEDAADVVQDVFVRVAESTDRLRGIEDPRAWLLTVAHRLAIDRARRRSRRPTLSLDDHLFLEPAVDDPSGRLAARDATDALAGLPDRQRVVIYLHHFVGCTFAETARITGVPTFTAASRYRSGIAKLRALLEKKR